MSDEKVDAEFSYLRFGVLMIVLLHDFDGLEANYEHDEVDYQVDPYRFGRVEK